MKEFMLLEKSQVEELSNRIWSILNLIRRGTPAGEFHIILFLISAYKDNIISIDEIRNQSQSKLAINEFIKTSPNPLAQKYRELLPTFESELRYFTDESLLTLLVELAKIDSKLLKDNFAQVFDSVFNMILQIENRTTELNIQPVEISRFINKISDISDGAKVYNPFAGMASFGVCLDKNQTYLGQEINQKTWALGTLRLMAYDRIDGSDFLLGDSIEEWAVDSRFDLIVSNPPFGMRVNNRFISANPSIKSTDEFLIEKGIQSLKIGGKLIAVLSTGILFKGGSEKRLREYLIENDLIDTIISFPGGLFQNTGIPFVVMIISNEKKSYNKVRFIKADNYVVERNKREKVLQDNLLCEVFKSNIEFNNDIRIIDNVEIKSNNFNLNIPRYFLKDIIVEDNEKLIKLKDLITNIRGQRVKVPEKGKFIRFRDLSDSKLDFNLDFSTVEVTEFNRPDVQQISESCLLLAMRSKTLKPTFFNFSGESIYTSRDIMAFKVNESVINHSYLINELNSEYVQDQIDAFKNDFIFPFVPLDDLLEIVIKLPSFKDSISDDISITSSLALQKLKVDGAKQAIIKSKEEALKLEKELLGIKDDAFREFASIKHTFRQYLSALKSNVAGTKKFIAKQNGKPVSLKDIYSKNLNETFGEHLENMDKTIDLLSSLLNTDKFESTAVEKLNFLDLVKEAQNCFKFDSFKYNEVQYDIITSDGIEAEQIEPIIEINKNDFFSLFSNIVSNAMNHGFKDSDRQYIIQSSISLYEEYEGYFVLEVANNGRPIPDKFTFKHLTTRGERTTDSKGAGIGGADIKNIVEKYDGKFELINDSKSMFPVTYRISFPIFNLD
jgi:type I restriction enzyme M protein